MAKLLTCTIDMNNELFKADPNRLFRKGDIVEIDDHGRNISKSLKKLGLKRCVRYTVTKDESADGYVEYTGDDGVEHLSMFFWLKLVTPVTEAEPFYVERCDTDGCYFIQKDDGEMSPVDTLVQAFYFKTEDYSAHYYTEGQAEELANETCKRLNDEWRKEHNHA